jgi:hypothetical protein
MMKMFAEREIAMVVASLFWLGVYCVSSVILYGVAMTKALDGRPLIENDEFLSWLRDHKFYYVYCFPCTLIFLYVTLYQWEHREPEDEVEYSVGDCYIPYDGPVPIKMGVLHHASYWRSILTDSQEFRRTR